jgi:hypothetical protein
VDIDGRVHGSVIAFNGSVDVRGVVTESVISFAGPVRVAGEVNDDVWATEAPELLADGSIGGSYGRWSPARFAQAAGVVSRFGFWLAGSISTLILGVIFLLLAPRALDAFATVGRDDTGQATGVGLLVFFGLPLAAIAAFSSMVGIPLGLWISLALLAIYAVGYTISAWVLGTVVSRKDRATSFMIGWIIARAVAIVPFIGGVAWFAGAVIGLGAIGIVVWRNRTPVSMSPATPAAA